MKFGLVATVATIISSVSAVTTGKLGDAKEVQDNCPRAIFRSFLRSDEVEGIVSFLPTTNGTGLTVVAEFSKLPADDDKIMYHIHEKRLEGGSTNCTSTGGHLDPYQRGDEPPAEEGHPERAEVGDLSGKHGTLSGAPVVVSYVDKYLANRLDNPAYIGNHSVVVHRSDKTRIACSNIELVAW